MWSLFSFLLIKASNQFLGLWVVLSLSNWVKCVLQSLIRPVLTKLYEPSCYTISCGWAGRNDTGWWAVVSTAWNHQLLSKALLGPNYCSVCTKKKKVGVWYQTFLLLTTQHANLVKPTSQLAGKKCLWVRPWQAPCVFPLKQHEAIGRNYRS